MYKDIIFIGSRLLHRLAAQADQVQSASNSLEPSTLCLCCGRYIKAPKPPLVQEIGLGAAGRQVVTHMRIRYGLVWALD